MATSLFERASNLWKQIEWTPKRLLVLLIASHLLMTFLLGRTSSNWSPRPDTPWGEVLGGIIELGSIGVLVGQLGLLACYGAFAAQPILIRIPRFLALCAWFLLSLMLGSNLLGGDWGGTMYEESTAYLLRIFAPSLTVLYIARLTFGRYFVAATNSLPSRSGAYQFSILQLLLIMGEVATLLALVRIAVPWNSRWAQELMHALYEYHFGGHVDAQLAMIASVATILPSVFAGVVTRRWKVWLCVLCGYLFLWTIGSAMLIASILHDFSTEPPPSQWWGTFHWEAIPLAAFFYGAAGTIVLTLWLVRRIGYDFRRPGESPDSGLPKSRSSAASSSA